MKKLVIAAAAIAMSVMANAATIKWSCPNGIADGTEAGVTSAAVAYLVNIADITQSDIYNAVMAGATLDSVVGSIATKSIALDEGGFNATSLTTTYADGTSQTLFMVCQDDSLNAIYFSEEISKKMLGVGDTKYTFGANSSIDAAMADMSGFDKSYGGWVSTAAVPEPTSGLLMLLGMAGLALRRRRA